MKLTVKKAEKFYKCEGCHQYIERGKKYLQQHTVYKDQRIRIRLHNLTCAKIYKQNKAKK